MINKEILANAIKEYKAIFKDQIWKKESYKWRAVKHFQETWDINTPDFAGMLDDALSKTENLLDVMNVFPRGMIVKFAKNNTTDVKHMFEELYDDSLPLYDRINHFKDAAKILLDKGTDRTHYQDENAISIYLWLRYPNKYYIYKLKEIQAVSSKLESNYEFKRGKYENNINNYFLLYSEVNEFIKDDQELRALLTSCLTDKEYEDSSLITLTADLCYYISRNYGEWGPKDYNPGITVDKWKSLVNNETVFTKGSLEIMKRIIDFGGEATCSQLASKYGGTKNLYNSGSFSLGKRIYEFTNCKLFKNTDGDSKYWPVIYLGKKAEKEDEGVFAWKIRDELVEALKTVNMSNIELYVKEESQMNYWFLNAKPQVWSIDKLPVGDRKSYTLYNENGNKRRIFQNFLDAKVDDLVIGYESTPVKKIVALARVSEANNGKTIEFEKLEGLSNPITFSDLNNSMELQNMEYLVNPQGSLFKLTEDEFNYIMDMIRETNPKTAEKKQANYTDVDFLNEVFISKIELSKLKNVLKRKKNIVLQGPPGVGKTFIAKRLAYSIMNEKNDDRIEMVQFHQNYSYEDFVMGYRPTDGGFELRDGIFYCFCQRAKNNSKQDFFFIIDEINRGNLSKIFGELLMMIENEYRDSSLTLAYNGLEFSVPSNVYIIGMMNTADRSLAMIDYALRRRFSFFDMKPGFDSNGFVDYSNKFNDELFLVVINKIKELNEEIINDKSLGEGFSIGHSYFCNLQNPNKETLQEIIEFDILPLLNEYWFDDTNKYIKWKNIFDGLFNED